MPFTRMRGAQAMKYKIYVGLMLLAPILALAGSTGA
jgi:hypothetical protein